MSRAEHVADGVLRAFAQGVLDEEAAVNVALHLDGCALCAARVASADPLHAVLDGVIAPTMPPGLVAAVLAEVADPPEPDLAPWREVGVGLAFLCSAGLLLSWGGEPVALLVDAVRIFRAVEQGAVAAGASTAWAWSAGAMLLAGGVLLLAGPERSAWLERLDRGLV